MIVLQEQHTVFYEIIDKLAQDNLVCYLRFDGHQLLVDFFDGFLCEEDVEVAVAELQPFLHVHIAQSFDDCRYFDGKVVEPCPVYDFILVVLH